MVALGWKLFPGSDPAWFLLLAGLQILLASRMVRSLVQLSAVVSASVLENPIPEDNLNKTMELVTRVDNIKVSVPRGGIMPESPSVVAAVDDGLYFRSTPLHSTHPPQPTLTLCLSR